MTIEELRSREHLARLHLKQHQKEIEEAQKRAADAMVVWRNAQDAVSAALERAVKELEGGAG